MEDRLEHLWRQYKNKGDMSAKEQLIIYYVEIVKMIAGRLYSTYQSHVEFDDLVGYGVLGLLDAIERFDLEKQVRFETYANLRIRGAIVDQIRSLDWIPRSKRQKFKQIETTIDQFMQKQGSDFTDAQVADALGISLSDYGELLAEMSVVSVVSLEEKLIENANFNIRSEERSFSPEGHLEDKELQRQLMQAIDSLPERERLIVSLYYYEELTYKEIAQVLQVSESRISQLHTKAIIKMRSAMV